MSSPTEWAMQDAENETALGLITAALRHREGHETDEDFATYIMSGLIESGLIVIKRSEWVAANKLRHAIATVLLAAKIDPSDLDLMDLG